MHARTQKKLYDKNLFIAINYLVAITLKDQLTPWILIQNELNLIKHVTKYNVIDSTWIVKSVVHSTVRNDVNYN